MTLLWADPFDQYAGDEAAMSDGPFANIGTSVVLSNAKPRTGGWSLLFGEDSGGSSITDNNGAGSVRRVFGGAKVTAGAAYALWCESLPAVEVGGGGFPSSGALAVQLFNFLDAAGQTQVMITLGTDGAVVAYRGFNFTLGGDGWTLLGRSDPAVRARAYNHIEAWVTIDDTAGAVEVRVNGVTYLSLTGIDTKKTSNTETSQWLFYSGGGMTAHGAYYLDDLFACDSAGAYNNDFVGDKKAFYLPPTSDTATADWVPSTGALSWPLVGEAPPNDSDYLSTASATATTILGLGALPGSTTSVAGVISFMRAWKDDAGTCSIKPGIKQGSTAGSGAAQPITTSPQYYQQVFEQDPVSAAPFTPADVNSLDLVLERTA